MTNEYLLKSLEELYADLGKAVADHNGHSISVTSCCYAEEFNEALRCISLAESAGRRVSLIIINIQRLLNYASKSRGDN